MDMAVANLFKHEIRFELKAEGIDLYEPMCFKRTRYYESPFLENVKSLGLKNVNDLCLILCKPFVLYLLSKIAHEDHVIPIDNVTIMVGVIDLGDQRGLTRYRFENPLDSPELFSTHADVDSCSFPDRLLNERTLVFVEATCYYICSNRREEARFRSEFNYDRYWQYPLSIEQYLNTSDDDLPFEEVYDSEYTDGEEEYTPPTETYRQDCCVICLEAKPNILYLDCGHIAICDSCDCLKKTGRHKCDVCRSRVFERVKI